MATRTITVQAMERAFFGGESRREGEKFAYTIPVWMFEKAQKEETNVIAQLPPYIVPVHPELKKHHISQTAFDPIDDIDSLMPVYHKEQTEEEKIASLLSSGNKSVAGVLDELTTTDGGDNKTVNFKDANTDEKTTAIINALQALDHDNDDHWTDNGLPQVEVIKEIVKGKVSRGEINAAYPGFVRETK